MPKKIIFGLAVLFLIFFAIFWRQKSISKKGAQGEKVFHVGLLEMAPTVAENIQGFKLGMNELGFKEGKNIIYTYRDAEGNFEKLKEYARELVDMHPDLIFVNTSPATEIIKRYTQGTDIPVVFSMVADPLGAGFIKSFRSSGNNLTGTSCAYIEIAPKRLAVLKEIDPRIKRVLLFYRPEDKSGGPATEKILKNAPEIGVKITAVPIKKKEDIRDYLSHLHPGDVDAIIDPADALATAGLMEWGVKRAEELKIPLFMLSKEEVEKGALASYGVDYIDLGKQSSLMASQILRGVKPSDIPSERPRKFLFAINLRTAKLIHLTIPQKVLEKADLIIK